MFVTQAFAQAAAGAPAAGGGAMDILTSLAPILLLVIIFWLLIFRPQQKRLKEQQAMLNAIKRGDTVSALLALYLLVELEEFPNHLLWVYLPTAIGGLILNYLFLVSGLVPRAIAVLGLIGYALLLLTVPLDLLGAVDVEKGAGLAMLAPGGLYEFLVLPTWLFAKGFRMPYAS